MKTVIIMKRLVVVAGMTLDNALGTSARVDAQSVHDPIAEAVQIGRPICAMPAPRS